MLRKLLFAVLGFISLQIQAQLLKPLAQGVGDEIYASTIESGDLYVTTRHFNGTGKGCTITVFKWNDVFWQQPYQSFLCNDSCVIRSMCFYKENLYIAGSFISTGTAAKNVIRYNTLTHKWEGFNTTLVNYYSTKSFINSLAVYKNQLYFGGEFNARMGSVDSAYNIMRYNGSSFSRCATNNEPGTTGNINDMFVFHDTLYVGGSFQKAGTTISPALLAWDSIKWIAQGFTSSATIGKINSYQNKLIFTAMDSQQQFTRLYVKTNSSYQNIATGFVTNLINDLEEYNNELWISGTFNINSNYCSLIRLSGSNWSNPGLPFVTSTTYSGLTKYHNNLIVFSPLDMVGSIRINHIAQISLFKSRISGHVYIDVNSNCKFDAGDKPFAKKMVAIRGIDTVYTMTDSFGFYSALVSPDSYIVALNLFKNWKIDSPCSRSKYNVNLSTISSKDSLDFSLKPLSFGPDIKINITPDRGYTALRGGTEAYLITYSNNGTQDISSASIKVNFDKKLSGFASPQNFNLNLNEATWAISNLKVGEKRNILFTTKARVDSFNINERLEFIASSNLPNDLDNKDNIDTVEQGISSDPTKPVQKDLYPSPSPGDSVSQIIPAEDEINYIIHFENTSLTDTIRNLVIIDTLDLNANILGYTETGASHPYTTRIYECPPPMHKIVVVWTFANINLPPYSNSDEVNNRGHIGFKVNLKSNTPIGTMIKNTAHVVMDYIDVQKTNTTYAKIVQFKGIDKKSGSVYEQLCTNPVNNTIKLFKGYKSGTSYSLYNSAGAQVLSGILTGREIDVNGLAYGVYFLILQNETEIKTQKILIN